MPRHARPLAALLLGLCLALPCVAKSHHHAKPAARPAKAAPVAAPDDGVAEARLVEVLKLVSAGHIQAAQDKVEKIVQDYPNFQLAQLVQGDLLLARTRPVNALGDVPADMASAGSGALGGLRDESRKRLSALTERPRAGTVPSQFLEISKTTRHAIAVDASRSRLYVFENRPSGLTLVADYYTSVGKAGVSKTSQGDQRTPLGVYYITSHLEAKSLKEFYGSGALPINYPNVLDMRRGKTGGGIWLHGTPPNQFSRAPLATDGCLVMANPDLLRVIQTVEVGSTPVVIAPQLEWVDSRTIKMASKSFEDTLIAWRNAKADGDMNRLLSFYAPDFNSYGKSLDQWAAVLKAEMNQMRGHSIELKDASYLRWTDSADTMVVTFGEVERGKRTGWTKRQYWIQQAGKWKIFFEGMM